MAPLRPEEVETFRRQGFLRGSRVLDEAAVEELRQELERVLEGQSHRGTQAQGVGRAVRNS
jgi:hypothetical protein